MIPEIKKILHPTDLSENARYAFGYAASLANRYGAGITILNVVEELPPSAFQFVDGILGEKAWENIKKRHKEQIIQTSKDRIEGFCNEVKNQFPACPFMVDDVIVDFGHPVDRIMRQVKKSNCDMVVMGSRGHGILVGTVVGSTSRRVILRCKKPVMVVYLPEEDD